jgi:hypothetical protein
VRRHGGQGYLGGDTNDPLRQEVCREPLRGTNP